MEESQQLDQAMGASSGGGIGGIILMLVYLAVIVLAIVMNWKVYAKAGQPGWSSIVPIYNIYVLTQIVNRPILWFIIAIFLCPPIGLLVLMMDLYKAFGKEGWHALIPIYNLVVMYDMAFGAASYTKPEHN